MCQICGHTVQRVNEGKSPVTYWCPRCGTLKTDGVPDHEPTHLTRRQLEVCLSDIATHRVTDEFLESINTFAHAQALEDAQGP